MDRTYLLDDGTLNSALMAETGTPSGYGMVSLDDVVANLQLPSGGPPICEQPRCT